MWKFIKNILYRLNVVIHTFNRRSLNWFTMLCNTQHEPCYSFSNNYLDTISLVVKKRNLISEWLIQTQSFPLAHFHSACKYTDQIISKSECVDVTRFLCTCKRNVCFHRACLLGEHLMKWGLFMSGTALGGVGGSRYHIQTLVNTPKFTACFGKLRLLTAPAETLQDLWALFHSEP